MNTLAIPLAAMLLCVLGELLIRKRRRAEPIPWRELALNLDSGHLVMWYFRGLEIAAFGLVLEHANLHWVDQWSPPWQWVFAFVAWDFCFYWMHRLHHRIPLLWAIHVLHHQGEHFNLSLGIRNSWYSSLSNLPFIIGLAVLGVPLDVFIIVSSIHYAIQFYNHNGLVGDSGLLERWMVTPMHHRVHHGLAPAYVNRNFGGTFLLWDKLFGSFQRALPDVPLRYGTAEPAGSNNPLIANNAPLLRLLAFSQQPVQRTSAFRASDILIGLGSVLLFAVVIHYISAGQGGIASGAADSRADPAWAHFALIVLATLALGAVADGRRWAAPGWTVVTATLLCLFLATPDNNAFRYWTGLIAYTALGVHGILTCCLSIMAHQQQRRAGASSPTT